MIVLLPEIADVVLEEQEPPYVIVPASEDENVKFGVVSFVGVVIAVTRESIGAVSSADVNPFEVVYEFLIEFPTTSFTKVVTLIL